MRDRAEQTALNAFVADAQRVISRVARAVVIQGRTRNDTVFVSTSESSIALTGPDRLRLAMLRHVGSPGSLGEGGSWSLTVAGYWYLLRDEDGSEVAAFHWHPREGQKVRFPHFHITGGAPSAVVTRRSRVPTGHVSLAAVVRFAIAELGVRPQRADWERVLGAAD